MQSNSTSGRVASAILILVGLVGLAVVGGFSLLSALYWKISLSGESETVRNIAIGVSFAVSFTGAGFAWASAHKRSAGLLIAAFVFMGADCAQNAMGYQSLGQLANGISQTQAAHDKAKADLMALPTPDANGAIRQMSTYEQTRSALMENVTMTEAALKAAKVTKFEDAHVLAVFGLLQMALLLAFRGLGKGNRPEPEETPVAASVERTAPNVHIFTPKQMDKKDQTAWANIAKA